MVLSHKQMKSYSNFPCTNKTLPEQPGSIFENCTFVVGFILAIYKFTYNFEDSDLSICTKRWMN